MATTEPFFIARYIQGTLAADGDFMAPLSGLFRVLAPQSPMQPYPFAVYHMASGQDVLAGFGGTRIVVNAVYEVQIYVGGTSLSGIEAAAARIAPLLEIKPPNAVPFETADGYIGSCVREQVFERAGVDTAGQVWSAYTQQFRIQAHTN